MPVRIPLGATIRVPLKAYLSSDHISDATSKTIVITISKNGAGFGNPNAGATNATEVGGAGNGNGWYYVDLDATDTGTLGPLIVRGTVATVDNVEIVYQVAAATNGGWTALPAVAADGAGGLPISDAGGLDLDTLLAELGSANLPADVDNLKEAVFVRRNTAQTGAAGSITLDASASAVTDFYKTAWIVLVANTGVGQARLCTAYNGTTKVASVAPNWATNPDVTTVFMVVPAAGVDLEMVLNAVITGGTPDVNVTSINDIAVTGPDDLKADVSNLDAAVSTLATPAQVNEQVDAALNTAIPGSPTADSINERIAAIDDKLPSGSIGDATAANQTTIIAKTDNLPTRPKKNAVLTAFSFLMIDSTDDISGKTGLTVSATISKDGGSFAATANSVAEIANGIYKITLTATEMNADVVCLRFAAAGANDRFITILTSP